MGAGIYNFVVEQGATWSKQFFFAQSDKGLITQADSENSIVVDATAKTFTRDDGGSWIDDGLQVGDYLVNAGLQEQENNGSHIITALTALVITCAGSTLKDETAVPSVTGEQIVILKAEDLTGLTGAAMVRKRYKDTAAAATIAVSFDALRVNGAVTLSMANTVTAAITCGEAVDAPASQYVWDFETTKTSTGVVTRRLQGVVSVSPEATK
jgi:hypothetical protein